MEKPVPGNLHGLKTARNGVFCDLKLNNLPSNEYCPQQRRAFTSTIGLDFSVRSQGFGRAESQKDIDRR
jgi:hypothetical protein